MKNNPLLINKRNSNIIIKVLSAIKRLLHDKDNSTNKIIKYEQPNTSGIIYSYLDFFSIRFIINIFELINNDSFINLVVMIIIK